MKKNLKKIGVKLLSYKFLKNFLIALEFLLAYFLICYNYFLYNSLKSNKKTLIYKLSLIF